jgi:pyruvate-formate lyase-activating enzyme
MRAMSNPPNPYESTHRELLEPSSSARLELYDDETREILSRNDSPDLSFRWSVNPYRGCFHACAYCYARPTHEYWGFGAGTDFESKIIVKRHAAALLRRAFEKPSWKGELIVFSGNTDCYQPIEASLELTRSCLEVCVEYRNPVAIITKGVLVLRDLDILKRLQQEAWVRVYCSIPFADDEVARRVEPQAPTTRKRFEAMARLSDAGIPTGVSIAPIIPGLNQEDSCTAPGKPVPDKRCTPCYGCRHRWNRFFSNAWQRPFLSGSVKLSIASGKFVEAPCLIVRSFHVSMDTDHIGMRLNACLKWRSGRPASRNPTTSMCP